MITEQIQWRNAPKFVIARRPKADVAILGRHFQFVQGVDKTHGPIASVAAVSDRLVRVIQPRKGADALLYPPGVSFRGAKRRGNLVQAVTNSPGVPCYPVLYCEIAPQGHFLALRAQGATSASGLLAMTNLVVDAVGDATL